LHFETYPFEKLNILLKDIESNNNLRPLNLTIGEPQFKTPNFILDELNRNIELFNRYPKSIGEGFLRESILKYLTNRFNLELDLNQIIPTFGTREVLFNFPQFYLFDKKSPTMAFPNPFYQIYEGSAIASRAKVIYMNLTKENNFKPELDKKSLEEVDLVIINTPNNPTSSTLLMEELKRWVELALEYNFLLLNDECYIDLYLDEPLPSLLNASIEVGNGDFKNILVVNSISKRSSAPGLRSGFIAGDSVILKEYMQYRTYVGCASPLPLQYASASAWAEQSHVDIFRKKYIKNFEIAEEILGLKRPLATFYIWLEVGDDIEFTKRLYRDYNLKVIAGSFLGREGMGRGFVRLALVYGADETKEALIRVKDLKDKM
jgi:aspartate/methionine/tyrosine aminotransferase